MTARGLFGRSHRYTKYNRKVWYLSWSPSQQKQVCLVYPSESDPSQSPLPSDIPFTRQGFCLLCCPIGPPPICEEVFRDRIAKVKFSLRAVHELGDAQLETTLLRSCFALPKFSYILCTCPPSYISQVAKDFDNVVRKSLESILGGPMSEWSWQKASLPSSRGGSIFAVPHFMPLLLIWVLSRSPSLWLR